MKLTEDSKDCNRELRNKLQKVELELNGVLTNIKH